MKSYSKCNEMKSLDDFHNRKDTIDGKEFKCKFCRSLDHKNRYVKMVNPAAKTKEQIAAHKRQKYAENPEKVKEINKKWINANREKRRKYQRAFVAKYRAQKNRAQKNRASFIGFDAEIRKIYDTCPLGYHVDHIVPLNGRNVCGLHVPWNLQHLPAQDNLRKSNKVI